MKKFFTFIIFAFTLIICGYMYKRPDASTAVAIKNQYITDLKSVIDASDHLASVTRTSTTSSISNLKASYLDLRKKYKSIEYLIEYIDFQYVTDHINGAPIPKLERKATEGAIKYPSGLQVIEEMLEEDEPDIQKLQKLTSKLSRHFHELKAFHTSTALTDRQIYEAVRLHLNRVSTLTITGFDSPALHSLNDAQISLGRASKDFSSYYELISSKDRQLVQDIDSLFQSSLTYLALNQDFETFDRAFFMRDLMRPLNGKILDAQLKLGIETIYETSPKYVKHSTNYLAGSMFDKDFLNPIYYLQIPSEKFKNPEVIELGKMLFYDPILSSNNERACASCHNPDKAFTDGKKKSIAFDFAGTIQRNAPTLVNAVFAERYFYDLRADDLQSQVDHVVFDHKEFNTGYFEIFDKLRKSEEYLKLFKACYPEMKDEDLINGYTLRTSVAAFVASLYSFDAPFDQYMRGEQEIDKEVIDGFNVFMGKGQCGTCHFPPTFNGLVPPNFQESESEVLGVPMTNDTINPKIDPDIGRANGKTLEAVDIYKHAFKTTTVRNAAITAPYMHNGVYETLEEVMDFYNKGGGHGLGLDVPNQTLPTDPLELSDQEINNLVAFVESLTDTTGLTSVPDRLPAFPDSLGWNARKIGGIY